ncbi:MAG: bifunctional oligoribonuclease/PAP phosphatase NrnA [Patescibacteria group bacterium]|nr:bifunctional oligoribonuclease/PAP phosphatase NrnA [Patescibacteria group bacterium]
MDLDRAITAKFLEAFQKIKEAENILLVTHERADGDAVSSLCALVELCENLGKKYTAFCPGEPISQYSFLPHTEKIIFDKMAFSSAKPPLGFKNFTLIIALDCGSLERTGLPEEIKGRNFNQFFIEFDHHLKNGNRSDLEIRKPEAVATTEILYYFFKANKIKINKNFANCVLTGILTDTGNFLYSPTSQKSINIASEMMLCGARFPQIVKNTVHNKSLPAMKVWGLALNNLKINRKYNFAFSILTLDEIEKFSSEENEDIFDSISGFLSNLYGVKGVLFLREEKGGRLKGSLRSAHPKTDVSRLASKLGGGGHVKASGFVLEGKIEKENNNWKVV